MDRKKNKAEHIDIGIIDIAEGYIELPQDRKDDLCNIIIDSLFKEVDKHLDPEFSRISFIDKVLESSIITNEQFERYEICQVLMDCRKLINE
jgi:hypothetical protein